MELHDENKKNTRNFEIYIENCTEVIYYVNCLNDETAFFASSAVIGRGRLLRLTLPTKPVTP